MVSSNAELNNFKNSTDQLEVYLSRPVTFDDVSHSRSCILARWGSLVPSPWGERVSPGGWGSGLGRNVQAEPTVNVIIQCFLMPLNRHRLSAG